MIGTSLPEYIFIRISTTCLRAITPLSILYCSVCVIRPPQTIFPRILAGYAAIEAAFYLLVYLPRKYRLQRAAQHPDLLSRDSRQELFERCCSTLGDPEAYLRMWFLGSDLDEIKRDNVKEFFGWAFLNTGEIDDTHDEELEGYVQGIEGLLGKRIEPGTGQARCLRLTIEKVDMMHRSFLWYMIVGLVDTSTAAYLRYHGFKLYRLPLSRFFTVFPFRVFTLFSTHVSPAKNLSYWYRPHTSKTRLPVLFIHGIGIGLYPYAKFLAEINKKSRDDLSAPDGDIGVIAIEIMPISSRLTNPALPRAEMCAQINTILEAHGWDNFVLASHSLGTVVSTHLLHTPEIAPKIGPMLLVDPVTFMLHLPDVAYNFTARKPRRANEHQLYYFASKDMGVAHTLARHFFWSENLLWKEECAGRDMTVSLAGVDLIVNTEAVGRYLVGNDESDAWKDRPWTGTGLDVLWLRGGDHAQAFDQRKTRRMLVDVVKTYSRSGMPLVDVA